MKSPPGQAGAIIMHGVGTARRPYNRSACQRGTKRREYNANHASARKTVLCDFPLFGVLPGGAETAGRSRVTCNEKTVSRPFFLCAKKRFLGRQTANYKLENLSCATFPSSALSGDLFTGRQAVASNGVLFSEPEAGAYAPLFIGGLSVRAARRDVPCDRVRHIPAGHQ